MAIKVILFDIKIDSFLFITRNDHNIDFEDDCVVRLFVCVLKIGGT